jgi:hypothetical protein
MVALQSGLAFQAEFQLEKWAKINSPQTAAQNRVRSAREKRCPHVRFCQPISGTVAGLTPGTNVGLIGPAHPFTPGFPRSGRHRETRGQFSTADNLCGSYHKPLFDRDLFLGHWRAL